MKVQITCNGTVPLLMKNVQLADPLNPATKRLKALTGGKQSKDRTPEDFAKIEHAEFDGSLYWDKDMGPYVPGRWMEKALKDAGGRYRQGTKIQQALILLEEKVPLEYPGPRDMAGLWADENFRFETMVNSTPNASKATLIRRVRPTFRQWGFSITGVLDTTVVTLEDLNKIGKACGLYHGLGDWHPKFGRFEFLAEEVK